MPGKPEVHHDDVRAHVDHEPDCVLSVFGLADELQPAARECLRERDADQLLVVDEHDRDRPLALDARVVALLDLG